MFTAFVEGVTQPFRDTLDVLDGLTEGEMRVKAATRVGIDIAAGLSLAALLELLDDE